MLFNIYQSDIPCPAKAIPKKGEDKPTKKTLFTRTNADSRNSIYTEI